MLFNRACTSSAPWSAQRSSSASRSGFATLWNSRTQSYDWAVHEDGFHQPTNWSLLYPDALQQAWVVAFGLVTPFFFLKGGMNVSLGALGPHLGALLGFFLVKIAAKSAGVFPLARLHMPGAATYTTLLMSTGLTFGTISALYGLQAGHIDRAQFSILLTVVIGTAIVPTVIAQRWFRPRLSPEEQEEALAREGESI